MKNEVWFYACVCVPVLLGCKSGTCRINRNISVYLQTHTHTFRDTQTDSKRCLTCIKTRPLSLYLVFILMYFYFRGNPAVFPRRVEVMWILKSYCFLNKWASSHKIFHVCTHTLSTKLDMICCAWRNGWIWWKNRLGHILGKKQHVFCIKKTEPVIVKPQIFCTLMWFCILDYY